MQEPQYRSPGVRELLDAVGEGEGAVHVDHEHAAAALPRAHSRASTRRAAGLLHRCRRSGTSFDPAFMTLCSPDPQAFRPPEEKVNVLQVRLPTNFKSARFASDAHTAILRQLEAGHRGGRAYERPVELPVKLKVHDRSSCRSPSGRC